MSKKLTNKCRINGPGFGTSVTRMMLLTCARLCSTNMCCVLYALVGSESAGSIELMNRVNISYGEIAVSFERPFAFRMQPWACQLFRHLVENSPVGFFLLSVS